ncbi:F16A2 protein, partial [Bucco capensis]|nr:F16A2 protein [Bucco capensis]
MERMSWLSKLHPRAGGHRAPRGASLQSPVTADPETCLMVFKNHWAQVLRILERGGCRAAADDLSAVRNHTYQMLNLLAEDRPRGREQQQQQEPCRGPILEFVASEELLERLLLWHVQGDFGEERKVEQLKLYEMLLSQARQNLLCHRAVLGPLLKLLSLCAHPTTAPLEKSLVLLLNQLCVSVAKEPSVLELFFHSQADQGPANLIIFSLLIPFIHHEGVLGQQARDALLLIMAMSASNQAVARSITDNSYFCPVLATGLSALYSSLPRKLETRGDDWHCLRREDWLGVSSLVLFMNSLEFCNAVIQVAHPLVQKQLVDYVHNGFLVPVMGPALHKTSLEELIASTAYLELFLRSLTEASLLKTFLRFVLLHRHDGATILDTLVARIGSSSRLCMVSLSLFRTLLSLNCEDVMLQLVLRYLLPCSHVMLSQKRAVRELDIYGRTAAKFLSLIPRCCRPHSPPAGPPPLEQEEEPPWAKGHPSPPSTDSCSSALPPKPSTPSRLSFFAPRPASSELVASAGPARSPATPRRSSSSSSSSSPGPRAGPRWEEVSELDHNYLEYLRDARRSIEHCAWACRAWSAPYDGEEPPMATPSLPTSPSTPRTKKRGLPEEGLVTPTPPSPAELPEVAAGERKDSAALANGAAGLPQAPQEVLLVKKVRRSPHGEGAGGTQNGSTAWEPSVASLLDELVAPSEANGAQVSIEAFGEELRELEKEMKNGGEEGEELLATQEKSSPLSPEEEEEETFSSFSAEGSQVLPRPPDSLAQLLVASPPRALGPPASQPFTGPFVSVLFGKLENMLHNSLYVNFLLTGLVAQLACYPQPLLRSFLLNTNMVFQPSVKSLLQVLGSVKARIESFAATQEDFPAMLFKAKKFLLARGRLEGSEGGAQRRGEALARSRKPSLGELLLRHTNSPPRARPSPLALQHSRGPGDGSGPGLASRPGEALRVKNAVYCAVIFSEFLKELAAIAQAHAVTSPFLCQ